MKKNDAVILSAAIVFSGLFYQQSDGLNYLLFTLLLSVSILIIDPGKVWDGHWWYYCTCCILTGAMIFIINSDLAVLACLASTLVLSGKSFNRGNSIVVCAFFAFFSLLSSLVYFVMELANRKNETGRAMRRNTLRTAGSIVISLLAVLMFFYLYKLANPLFNDFTKFINFDWFGFGWMAFTFLGFLIMYGLLKGKRIDKMAEIETTVKKDIVEGASNYQNTPIIAFVLFLMLNVMLVVLNGLDIVNIYLAQTLPEDITLSDFVHQAVQGIVFSIVIAISLIVWFFSGDMNFNRYGKRIKFLVYLWIGQSLLVVVNAIVRNFWYVQEFQLTHSRIGVFVFLVLCLVGLVLTYFKILQRQSAWTLATKNTNVWFALLVAMSLVNWDKAITNYNIQHATKAKPLDKVYLIELSDANLPELVQLYQDSALSVSEKKLVNEKALEVYKKDRFAQWPSFNLRSHQNKQAIKLLNLKW